MHNFNDVENKELQAYNRVVVFFNLKADVGQAPAEDYINQFSKEDRINMDSVMRAVFRETQKKFIARVTKDMEFVDE